jgi:hypothetical protein
LLRRCGIFLQLFFEVARVVVTQQRSDPSGPLSGLKMVD